MLNRIRVSTILPVAIILASGVAPVLRPRAARSASESKESASSAPLKSLRWADLKGNPHALPGAAEGKAAAFIFIATECPVTNLYTPRILELWKDYRPRGVPLYLVDSNAVDTPAVLRRYVAARKIPIPVLKDSGARLADWLGAYATPEAIVVDSAGTIRYRGRIDDNVDRQKVIRHDLSEALDDVLDGKPVDRPRTIPIGCRIFRDNPATTRASSGSVTYAHDIAPILDRSCVSCHRPGESAPFSLTTYRDARAWALPIRDYTTNRVMPPWKASPGFGDFKDARFLSSRDINTIARWVSAGAPAGDLQQAPPMPHFPPPGVWVLGRPDMILRSPAPFRVPAEGRDIYREFVLPVDFSTDRYLSGIELRPDNRAIVHHMILYLDPTGESAKLDGRDAEPGYTVPGAGIFPPRSEMGGKEIFAQGWAAGNSPAMQPAGMAIKVPAHAKLVLQVHYHMDGRPESDNSMVGLHFIDPAQVDKIVTVGSVINHDFVLAPGVANQKVFKSMKVPADVHLWSVSPHMHMLGRQMKIVATLPDGKTVPLIWVKDWDFNWQENYRYKEPIALPAGTRLDMMAIYDNSDNNPRQTTHPPREVRWGEQTSDEMCIGFFTYTRDSEHLKGTLSAAALHPESTVARR